MNRWREILLLLLAFVILGAGYGVVWCAYLPVWQRVFPQDPWRIFLAPAVMLAAWMIYSVVLRARRCRETLLLPLVAFLIGLGLLFQLRLAGGAGLLVMQQGGTLLPFDAFIAQTDVSNTTQLAMTLLRASQKQLLSFLVGWAALMGLTLLWRDYRALARYKYLVAATAIILLLLTTLLGRVVGEQTLTLRLGPLAFQPHDPVKLLLVIFMAAYLVEKRELLSFAGGRYGLLTLMDFRYLGPLVALWLLVMVIIFKHNDLGAALLLFGALLAMLYLGTERKSYLFIGAVLFLLGGWAAYLFSGTVQARVAIWLNPWRHADDVGYQICQALMALGNGRVIGAGLAGGFPERIPAVHTDLIYAAISEDLGLAGAVAVLALFLLLIGRMVHVALAAHDRFGQLLAAGLAAALALQTWVILAGTCKFIPLTGITLPFISYGGTSLVMNMVLLGIVFKVAEERSA